MIKTWLFLVTAALLLPLAAFGQDEAFKLTFGWDFKTETGNIQDMHFMPGEEQFIFTTDGHPVIGEPTEPTLQIRDTKTGKLIEKIPGFEGHIEFTPDSTQIIIAKAMLWPKIEIFDLNEKTVIKKDTFRIGKDSIGPLMKPFKLMIEAMDADPVRPLVYLIYRKSTFSSPGYLDSNRLLIYDYDKMEIVGDLTPAGFEEFPYFEKLAISKDGKYLAALNEGRAHLWVWDLETRERITSLRLYDGTHGNEFSTMIWDMKFSEIDTKKLYFTCFCYGNSPYRGLTIYDVEQNKVIDDRFMNNVATIFQFFDKEERFYYRIIGFGRIHNVFENREEFEYSVIAPDPGTWGVDVNYSKNLDLFVGHGSYYASSGTCNRGVSVIGDDENTNVIYPNPTTNLAYIPISCYSTDLQYEIYDSAGHNIFKTELINSESDQIEIDLSRYPNGTYFVKLYCGDTVKSYQIVKEG